MQIPIGSVHILPALVSVPCSVNEQWHSLNVFFGFLAFWLHLLWPDTLDKMIHEVLMNTKMCFS